MPTGRGYPCGITEVSIRSGGIHDAERHAPSRACSWLSRLAVAAAVLVGGVSAVALWSAPDPDPFHHLAESGALVWVPSLVVSLVLLQRVKLRVGRYLAWWLLASGLSEMTAALVSAVAGAWDVPA